MSKPTINAAQDSTQNVKTVSTKRKLYFINEIVEWDLTKYIWTGCTRIELRDQIMSNATELIRQIIRKQGLHTIYPGQEESAFGDLLQTAWVQIEKTLYKYRARPHCRTCYSPDHPAKSLLYIPGEREYGIKTMDEVMKMHRGRLCPHCDAKLANEPIIEPVQDLYGGSETIIYRGMSKVFNMWCVSPDTMIPTCHGPLAASEVRDHFEAGLPVHVDGLDGLALVEAVKCRDYTDTLRFTTECGYELECSPEHRLYIHNHEGVGWPEAHTITTGDLVAIRCGQNQFGEYCDLDDIQLTKRGKWVNPPKITEELAYFLGLYIAEGSYSYGKLVIYNIDDEIIDKLVNNSMGLNFIHEPEYQRVSLCNVRFIELMEQLGFGEHSTAQSKLIPPRLLCLPRRLIAKMLSGMFDGDGHSNQRNGNVGYTTSSKVLLAQLRMILLNFGIISKISHDKRTTREFKNYTSTLTGVTQLLLSSRDSEMFYTFISFGIWRKQSNVNNLKHIRDFVYGLNDRFRSLYAKYGVGHSNYNSLRRLLKADKCTIETAQKALEAWADYSDDIDYTFAKDRLVNHTTTKNKLVWLPIRQIVTSSNELLDFAVDTPSHSYVANGMVVHNSQIARTVILAYIKKEGRDRKNSQSYVSHLGNKSRPVSDVMVRFLEEARQICTYNEDHMQIIQALEWLLFNDDRPHDGTIGKLVARTGLSRAIVTGFIRLIKLRSFEFTDSPINRNIAKPKDRRRLQIDFEE